MWRDLRTALRLSFLNRPMVLIVLAYGAGLVAGDWTQVSWRAPACLTALAAGALLVRSLRRRAIWPALFLCGWTNMEVQTGVLFDCDLRLAQGAATTLATLRGTLAETPVLRVYSREGQEAFRSSARLRVTEMLSGTNWLPVTGTVLAGMPGTFHPRCCRGTVVEVTGILGPPPGAAAPGLFDYASYLRREGIYYQLRTANTNDWVVLSAPPRRPWSDLFLSWAKDVLQLGLPEKDPALRLLWSMTLGWKTGLTNDFYEPFTFSGTMHIFAISGLHIALISGLLVSMFRFVRLPRTACGLLVLPLIWFYTAATGWQPSAVRSTLMMSVVIGGWALARPGNLLNSLAAAAFLILLWEPQQLFGASFQLSFFVVLSLALLQPLLEAWRRRLLQPDPYLAPSLVRGWRYWVNTAPFRWLWKSVETSLAAWLGALPLTAHYFHIVSPVTLLANLVVVPLSSAALAANLGSLVVGAWFPAAAELFNASAWYLMDRMLAASRFAAELPEAYSYVPRPGWPGFLSYYLALIGAAGGLFAGRYRRWWIGLALGAVCLAFAVRIESSRAPVQLTVMPDEGGFAVYAHQPATGQDTLVDTGTTNTVKRTVAPFLRARGLDRISDLVLTHGDLRDTGGAEMIRSWFDPRTVWAGDVRFRSPTYRQAVQAFEQVPGLLRKVAVGDRIGAWSVLHPDPSDGFTLADDNALVLLGNFHGHRVLLLSDLGPRGQARLLERHPDLQADVIIAGLPSSGEPLSNPLLDAVRPKLAVVADAEFPAYARASEPLRRRLAQKPVRTIYTRFAGATVIECRPGQLHVRSMGQP